MKSKITFLLSALIIAVAFSACKNGRFPGFDQTDNGLYYNLIDDKEGSPTNEGDILEVDMVYRTEADSIVFDSRTEVYPVHLRVGKPFFHGDINEGIAMLTVGDSACFAVRADTFFLITVGVERLPENINPDSYIFVDVKVKGIKTKAEYEAERALLEEQMNQQLEELKIEEQSKLQTYIINNNIKTKPTQSGLYYIEQKAGSGPNVQKGQTVWVHYTGSFIDGQEFDSSAGYEPIEVVVGNGQVIDGWEEGLLLMKKGTKARLILPSSIAYGKSNPNSAIPPYATLIFDIEIVNVK